MAEIQGLKKEKELERNVTRSRLDRRLDPDRDIINLCVGFAF